MAKRSIKKYFNSGGNLIIKPYRTMDLCIIFDIGYKTFRSWVREHQQEIDIRKGIYYSIDQVEIMLGKFGRPHIAVQ